MASNPNDQFLLRVGMCITSWAYLEEHLFSIFHTSLRCPKLQASIIYFKTPGLEARLSLTDELVVSVLPKPEREDGGHHHSDAIAWRKIRNAIYDQLATRRRIAHHPIQLQKLGDMHKIEDMHEIVDMFELSRLAIQMSENEQLRGKNVTLRPLGLNQLRDHGLAVVALAQRLHEFHDQVLKKACLSTRSDNSSQSETEKTVPHK
jgi:hypothetical protein